MYIRDQISENGLYTRIQFYNFDEFLITLLRTYIEIFIHISLMSGKSSHNILKPYVAQLQAELHFLKVEKIGCVYNTLFTNSVTYITVQLNLNLTTHAQGNYTTQHISENMQHSLHVHE